MDQQTLVRIWEEAWTDGIWYASWEKAIDATAAQAAWKPEPGRHSIWQILNHMLFWQDYTRRALAEDKPGARGSRPAELGRTAGSHRVCVDTGQAALCRVVRGDAGLDARRRDRVRASRVPSAARELPHGADHVLACDAGAGTDRVTSGSGKQETGIGGRCFPLPASCFPFPLVSA